MPGKHPSGHLVTFREACDSDMFLRKTAISRLHPNKMETYSSGTFKIDTLLPNNEPSSGSTVVQVAALKMAP